MALLTTPFYRAPPSPGLLDPVLSIPSFKAKAGEVAEIDSPWAKILESNLEKTLRVYLRNNQIAAVLRAYRYAFKKHKAQRRASGEFYISHPVSVACRCACWRLDSDVLCAALLHDVVEDQGVPLSRIKRLFGEAVANIVDGVSKLDRLGFSTQIEADAENLMKMFLAMGRDVRVILVKLADRLHNMQTIGALPRHKIARITRETLEVYAPISYRLGLHLIYQELQDLAFRNLYPLRYATLKKAVLSNRGNRQSLISQAHENIVRALIKHRIKAELSGREKELYAIYQKMRRKHLHFSDIHDVYGIRIIVNDVSDCYQALGVLHATYKPLPGTFKDYIALPKANGYQSLHTTILGPGTVPIECQIRARTMHQTAESGVAAHWIYKVGGKGFSTPAKNNLEWLQSLLELQQKSGSAAEFLEHVRINLFPDSVYVFTPKGKVVNLPRAATVLDFAYAIHTDIGHQAQSCRINGIAESLTTTLKNGDIVDVITHPLTRPSRHSLQLVQTARARAAIRHYLREHSKDSAAVSANQSLGRLLLLQTLAEQGEAIADLSPFEPLLVKTLGCASTSTLYIDIATGKRPPRVVAQLIVQSLPQYAEDFNKAPARSAPPLHRLAITPEELSLFRFAPCCTPIPGDTIFGYYQADSGVMVHREECRQQRGLRRSSQLALAWGENRDDEKGGEHFPCNIRVIIDNNPGEMAKVANCVGKLNINITNALLDNHSNTPYSTLSFTIEVRDRQQLGQLFRVLHRDCKPRKLSRQ